MTSEEEINKYPKAMEIKYPYKMTDRGFALLGLSFNTMAELSNILDKATTAEGQLANGYLKQIYGNLSQAKNEISKLLADIPSKAKEE
jgi:hypothetical protein